MTDYLVTDTELISVANAIRTRGGTQAQLEWPNGYVSAIAAIPSGGGGSVEIVPWSTGTDEQIVAMIEAAHNGDIDLQEDGGWAIGDSRTIAIKEFTGGYDGSNIPVTHSAQNIDIAISSFDDYNNCGCVMQFDFKDELAQGVAIRQGGTNVGGYSDTEVKSIVLPALVNALPTYLKSLLIEFSCLASAGGQSGAIETIGGNKLALRSEIEVFGTISKSKSGEGSQTTYYTATANRIKKRGHLGNIDRWWLRSPGGNTSTRFLVVRSDGTPDDIDAIVAAVGGIAPFGCL